MLEIYIDIALYHIIYHISYHILYQNHIIEYALNIRQMHLIEYPGTRYDTVKPALTLKVLVVTIDALGHFETG